MWRMTIASPSDGFQHDRSFLDGADGEDGYLRLVDDRGAHETAEGSDVGQGEGAALGIFRPQFALARIVGKGIDLAGQTGEVELIGVADDGDDEVAGGKGGSHPDIDILFEDDLIAVEGAVDQAGIS